MDSSIIITSMAIGAALFAGLIIFWFFHTVVKRRLSADQPAQLGSGAHRKNGQDMRRHSRLEISWPAEVEIGRKSIKVQLKDISLGGAFVICQAPVALNEKIRIYLDVPNLETLALNAEVVWSNMNVPEDKIIHRGMGVKFIQNTYATRKHLEEAIARGASDASRSAD